MKLTPLDIKKQEFRKGMRGYDPVEVDAFLEMVSEEMEELIRDRTELADEVLKLRTQLHDYKSVEKTLQDTLMSAQESVKESKENSNREAELVLRQAELTAEKIVEDARLTLAKMKNELVLVKSQKESFARRLRHLLDSQLELIRVLELDDLGFGRFEGPAYERRTTRPRRTAQPERSETNVEFGEVDDTPRAQEEAAEESAAAAEPHGLHWGKRQAVKEEPSDTTEPEVQSRISDQLLT